MGTGTWEGEERRSNAEYERGVEVGRSAQILDGHTAHLAKINGSVDQSAQTMAILCKEIRELREEARLREERVAAVAAALATDTESRRAHLADEAAEGDRQFTRRERMLATAFGAITVVLALLAYAGTVQ